MKKFIKLFIVSLIAVTCILPMTQVDAAVTIGPVSPIFEVSRNDGGKVHGTHIYPSYTEGSTQYYRTGDIIEVNFKLPQGNGALGARGVVEYDKSKVTMLSTFPNIRQSLSPNYDNLDWTSSITSYINGDGVDISAIASNYRLPGSADVAGGSLARIYFRVNDGVETTDGEPITFNFPEFSAIGYDPEGIANGGLTDTAPAHIGYDPNDHENTGTYRAPSQTIIAKKPSVNFNSEDAFIRQSDAKALNIVNDLKAVNKASAIVSDGTELPLTASTPNFNAIKAGTLGVYEVSYQYTYNNVPETKKAKVTVVSDNAIISPDNTVSLDANDAFISQTNAKLLASQNDLIALNNAKVQISNGTTGTPSVVAPGFANIKAGTIGSYNVTYNYGTGASAVTKTVKLNVVKDGSIVAPDGSASLYAEHGKIKESAAKVLTNKSQLAPYNAAEITLADGTVVAPNVDVSSADWLAISTGTKGSYNVLYSYGTGANLISKTVVLRVIGDGDEWSEDGKVVIGAYDVEVSQTEAKALANKESLIPLNKVSVTLEDGTSVTPTVTMPLFSSVKLGVVGTYPVTYTYGTGTSFVTKTVNVIVAQDKKHEIVANDAFLKVDAAKALSTKEDLRQVNGVQVNAIDGSHPNAVVTTSDWAAIKAGTIGTYTITYEYGYGDKLVSKQAVVTIVENDVVINDEASLYAKSAFINQSAAKALTAKEGLIPTNTASVTLLNGTKVTPNVVMTTGQWVLLNAGDLGVYDVTYTYGTGAKELRKEVTTTVIEDGSIVSPDGSVSLSAKNAFIETKDALKLVNKEQLRSYNGAVVTFVDGSTTNANVEIAPADWLALKQGTVGSYDVLYTYGSGSKGVSKTVKINVIANGSVISPDGTVSLSAEDGEMSNDEAKDLVNKEGLIVFNKATVAFADGTKATPNVIISTSSLNAIKAGTLGEYFVTYTYGTEGTSNYVSKTVKINVVKRTEPRHMFDYNNDKRIDLQDYAEFIIVYNTGGKNSSAIFKMLSDYNEDGRVDLQDLAEIRYYISTPSKKPRIIQIPVSY